MLEKPHQPPPLRRFQFRLRTLLLLVLVISTPVAWVANERRRIAVRREALAKVGTWFDISSQPEWHRWVFGDDTPRYARAFKSEQPITDANLLHFKGLSQLQWLGFHRSRVTDAGLVFLSNLNQLQFLALGDSHITDASLATLKGLSQLRVLGLYNTTVTNAGIAELQSALPNCRIDR